MYREHIAVIDSAIIWLIVLFLLQFYCNFSIAIVRVLSFSGNIFWSTGPIFDLIAPLYLPHWILLPVKVSEKFDKNWVRRSWDKNCVCCVFKSFQEHPCFLPQTHYSRHYELLRHFGPIPDFALSSHVIAAYRIFLPYGNFRFLLYLQSVCPAGLFAYGLPPAKHLSVYAFKSGCLSVLTLTDA